MQNSFHGRTLGAMTATGQTKYQEGFGPLPPGFCYARFNDLESVKGLLRDRTAAVLLEPVQGEGGIHIATREFMTGLRRLTEEKGILLILDEVQSGMGRTGRMFGYQHYGITPDAMVLAKSLGGGVPIGALLVSNKFGNEIFTPGTHASTYGGNPLVASAALAVLRAIQSEGLIERVNRLSPYLEARFKEFQKKYAFIREVRQLGFMCGLELKLAGAGIVEKCLERGLLINCTQGNVLRLLPAMNVPKKLLDKGLYILDKVLSEVKP
jgi:acetylornithine/N-succinyldiaminopimelate aminotransferase